MLSQEPPSDSIRPIGLASLGPGVAVCTAAANRVCASSVATEVTAMLRDAAVYAANYTASLVFADTRLKHLNRPGAANAWAFDVQHAAVAYRTMLGQ